MTFSLSSLILGNSAFHTLPFPLGCLLENLKPLHLIPDLKDPKLVRLCNKVWPQYPLDKQSKWPLNSTLDPNIIWNFYNYCEWLWKCNETLYVKTFSNFCSKPSLCASCSSTQFLLAMKSEQDESIPFDPANEPPRYRKKPTAHSHLVLSASLSPSSVTGHAGQLFLASTVFISWATGCSIVFHNFKNC